MKYLTLLITLICFIIADGQVVISRRGAGGEAPAGCDLLDENFDGETSGTDLTDITGWLGPGADTREVSNDRANSGSNSLKLTSVTSGYDDNYYGLGGQSSGDFLISFYVNLDNCANGLDFYFCEVPDSNNSNHAQVTARIHGTSESAYTLQYVNSSGTATTVLAVMSLDTWYHVEILMDMDNDDQSWKVDDTEYVSDQAFPYGNSGESATHIFFSDHTDASPYCLYIDDLCVNTDTSDY